MGSTIRTSDSLPSTGGIVLCGGLSSRMGQPKAWLPFGPELMLPRVVRIIGEVVSPIVVVAAVGQEVPPLPPTVQIVRDEYDTAGPLAGLAAGLAALSSTATAAYVSSCDVPLLRPEFVRKMIAHLGNAAVAIPRENSLHHPLAAVYRTDLAPKVRELLATGERRLMHLVNSVNSHIIDVEELRSADPQLQSLRNINSPEDYAAALHEAGFQKTP